LRSLNGKIATAHTADDNAETVLLHLVRGTGLKGLGGITPINGQLVRPMLDVTRRDVEAFCEEWCLAFVEDSSNGTDAFLRNRIRHQVMPLLKQENPKIAENMSTMARRLRLDEEYLSQNAELTWDVKTLKSMHPALRSRSLEALLRDAGVKEPEAVHMARLESLLASNKPSARAEFPGGVTLARQYDRIVKLEDAPAPAPVVLHCPGSVLWGGFRITACPAEETVNTTDTFTVVPQGEMVVRCREAGDEIRLSGGTKSLKKLFVDRKIPAWKRLQIPVLADEKGILGVYTIGADVSRKAESLSAVTVRFESAEK
jgi:tRNA(Ile)-lysidine synthase